MDGYNYRLHGVTKGKAMICKNCGQEGAYIHKTTEAYGTGDRLVVIEDIPVISCRNCGVDLLSADTLDHLHMLMTYLRSNPASRANERSVKVASFQESPLAVQESAADLALTRSLSSTSQYSIDNNTNMTYTA